MSKSKSTSTRYSDLSNLHSYVTVKVKDGQTGRIVNMVIENEDLAPYLAHLHGIVNRRGKAQDHDAYQTFVSTTYAPYMLQHEGQPLDIDLDDLITFVSARFGNRDAAVKYFNTLKFETPLTLKELGVNTKEELVGKYFADGILKEPYRRQYDSNPAFIALLIDLDLIVGRGDIIPFLFIKEQQP